MKTKIELEISRIIKKNKNNVKLFWDMDGTFSSMDLCNLPHKMDKGFFCTKRPIKTMLKIVKRFNTLGAETFIISYCGYNYQKEDKLKWLHKYCPFLKDENLIIIPRKEPNIKLSESKQTLKAEYIKDLVNEENVVFFVDDNESVLLGTKEKLPYINIISPMDFIE
jgi:hypothetical protein